MWREWRRISELWPRLVIDLTEKRINVGHVLGIGSTGTAYQDCSPSQKKSPAEDHLGLWWVLSLLLFPYSENLI